MAIITAQPTSATKQRLLGLDLARALAVLGMVLAHTADTPHTSVPTDPSTWTGFVNGPPSTLFAVLAGVTLALLSGGATPSTGLALRNRRARIAVRAGAIATIGAFLMLLGVQAVVILGVYGTLFLVLLPALAWRRRTLLIVAGSLALLALPLAILTGIGVSALPPFFFGTFGTYPPVTFAAFMLLGLALGRSDLRDHVLQLRLAVVGAVTAVVMYGLGFLLTPADPEDSPVRALLFRTQGHSSSLVDVLGSSAVAVAAIGICSLVADRRVLRPLVVLGSMSLSVYALHLVAMAVLDGVTGDSDWYGALAGTGFCVGVILLAVVWRTWFRQGPLERVVATVVDRAVPRCTRA